MVKQWNTLDVIERDPGRLGGVWVFRGTRVPVAALFENLRDGATLDEFLEWFPGVERTQVEAVLNHELQTLVAAEPSRGFYSIKERRRRCGGIWQSTP